MDYVTRAEWGARPPKNPPTLLPGASTGIAVHHEGDGLEPPTDCYAKMRSTQNYHMNAKGWNDIAYSWGVGCGLIFEGRGWGIQDGADTGEGRLMHSVVWLGDSSVAMPSDADLRAINEVIAEQANHGAATVVGHRDINATDCPGSYLYAWLQSGRHTSQPDPTQEPDDMPLSTADIEAVAGRVRDYLANPAVNPGTVIDPGARSALTYITSAVSAPSSGASVDVPALAAAIADNLGDDIARQVADELARRLDS